MSGRWEKAPFLVGVIAALAVAPALPPSSSSETPPRFAPKRDRSDGAATIAATPSWM